MEEICKEKKNIQRSNIKSMFRPFKKYHTTAQGNDVKQIELSCDITD